MLLQSTLSCIVCHRPWREVEYDRALGLYLRLAPHLRIVQVTSTGGRALYLPARPISGAVVAGRGACEAWPLHYWDRFAGLRALAWGDRAREGAMPNFVEFLAAYSLRGVRGVVSQPEARGAPGERVGGAIEASDVAVSVVAGAGGAPAPAVLARVAA